MGAYFKISPEAIALVSAGSKEAILAKVADQFAASYGVNREQVLESLQEREALGSTGFGRGVAIPHARIEGINRPVAILLRLDSPVEFDAADGMPVDLIFGLLSPTSAGTSHLHALAAISRLVRDESQHDALSNADSVEELYALLANATDRDVA